MFILFLFTASDSTALVPVAPSAVVGVPNSASAPVANPVTPGWSNTSAATNALIARKAPTMPKPKWHPPWKLYRVISGHLGWVRCVAVEPGNEWFATGSADRVIKVWYCNLFYLTFILRVISVNISEILI